MNNTVQKIEETKKELREWFDSPNAEEWFYLKPMQKINDLLEENTIRKSILNGFETLNNWFRSQFVFAALNSKNFIDFKTKTAFNGCEIISLTEALSNLYPNNPPQIMFHYSAFYLANTITMNWFDEAKKMILYLNKALETKTLNGGMNIKTTAWFIYEIVNKGFKVEYDYSQFNYPENMGVYQKVLDNWNTNDMKLLDEMVSDLCTFHIFQASHGSLSDSAGKSDPMFLQFSDTTWFVYAFEVLTWLAMREKQGLNNPAKYSHPLMNIELNQITQTSIKLPSDELFNKILSKIKV